MKARYPFDFESEDYQKDDIGKITLWLRVKPYSEKEKHIIKFHERYITDDGISIDTRSTKSILERIHMEMNE